MLVGSRKLLRCHGVAALHAYFEKYLAGTERLLAGNDRRGRVGLGGKKARSEQFVVDEDGTLLKDKVPIFGRWAGYFGTLRNRKSPKLNPAISDLFPQRPLAPPLGDELTMEEMTAVIMQGMPDEKAVGPNSLPSELLNLDDHEFIRYFHNLLVNVWRMGDVPQQWNDATIKVLDE